jgi:hypothetical protein
MNPAEWKDHLRAGIAQIRRDLDRLEAELERGEPIPPWPGLYADQGEGGPTDCRPIVVPERLEL